MMNQVSKEEVDRIRGRYTEKYGRLMDKWSPILFHEMHENFRQFESSVEMSVLEISKAAAQIKGSHKSIHFKSDREALFFGLGITAPAAFAGIVLFILIFWYASSSQDYQEKKEILDTYENVSDYVALIQKGEILEKDGVNYLVLYPLPKKGDITIGKEYIYDHHRKRVLVPLGIK